MKNIIMLGAKTSLGQKFRELAMSAGHAVHPIGISKNGDYTSDLRQVLYLINANIDWVVNCHGTNQLDAIGRTPYADVEGELGRLHPFTNSLLVDNVAPIYWLINSMVAMGLPGARVLSVASQTYRIAQTNTTFYCASKAALVQMSKVMARELAGRGWVINCIAPGKIEDTRMAKITDAQVLALRGWTGEEAEGYALRNVPMGRFTNRQEVCEAMLGILALPSYINGTCIDMTGGA